jgi:hypothetical protein
LLVAGHNVYDEVIELTDEDLAGGYYVKSRIFFGKIYRQRGVDQHIHDGITISLRTDLADVERHYPKAYLLDEDDRSSILIKDTKMSSVWAHGQRVTNAPETEYDGGMDRSSVLVDGTVPPHFILVRFPRGMRLKNVFTPWQVGCRQIKKVAALSQLPGMVTETDGPTERFWDGSGMVQVEKKIVKEQMHTYVQATFCVAKADNVTRFHAPVTADDAEVVRGLFSRLNPPSAAGTPPRTGSSTL